MKRLAVLGSTGSIGMNVLVNLFIVRYVGWRIDLSYRQWWRESVLPALAVMFVAGAPACGTCRWSITTTARWAR